MKTMGLGSMLTMKVLGLGGPEFLIMLLLVAAPIALYVLFIRPGAPYAHSTAFGRHLNFDHYHLDTIMKVLYMFSFVANILLCLFIIGAGFQTNYGGIALLGGIMLFFVLQGISRVIHEVAIIYVHMAEDVRGVREGLGYARPAKKTVSPEAAERAARRSAARKEAVSSFKQSIRQSDVVRSAIGAPANNAQPLDAYTPEVNQDQWVCSSCGSAMPAGKFCTKCGAPRP